LCKIKQASIADEATDAANSEQLSISIHLVEEDGVSYERFLCFHACAAGLTGESIANDIIGKVDDWQLKLRGQAYDGAGAMVGQLNGVAACIASKYRKGIHAVHLAGSTSV